MANVKLTKKQLKKFNKKLKRCPFCESKAQLMHMDLDGFVIWGVFCKADLKDEYSHGHYIDNYEYPQEAVDAWNNNR